MQPAQLSLLPEEYPAPRVMVLAQLPDAAVAEAIRLLARLIAKAANAEEEVAADE
jgi:hypothetical protein